MKRVTSFILAFVLILGVSAAAVSAEEAAPAAENPGMRASDAAVAVLKQMEGFVKYPQWDVSQWSVGYGSRCPDDMLDTYKKNGITEAEAETLLRNFLTQFENDINREMVGPYRKNMTQNQFDALVLFSYNCGTGWLYDSNGTFNGAIKNEATGNELIRAFALWCNADGQVLDGLLNRRLSEANLYLNGVYSNQPPENYSYVKYDANGGTVSPRSQGYDSNLTAKPYSVPKYPGYIFQGWYTQPAGGTKVTTLNASTRHAMLYAQWKDSNGNPPEDKTPGAVAVTVTGSYVNLREGPGTNYKCVGQVSVGDRLTITQTATGGSYLWGKSDRGWIALKYTNYDAVKDNQKPNQSLYGTVNTGDLPVYSGPGASGPVVGHMKNGERVQITQRKDSDGTTWGKTSRGWISMKYVMLDPDKVSPGNGSQTANGECLDVDGNTSDEIADYLCNGSHVDILETKTVDGVRWGRIESGWICLDFAK